MLSIDERDGTVRIKKINNNKNNLKYFKNQYLSVLLTPPPSTDHPPSPSSQSHMLSFFPNMCRMSF